MKYANEVVEMISEMSKKGISVERARIFAENLLPYNQDKTEMAEEGKYSYHYTYDDESTLIIDDEGFVYASEDDEINILCEMN